MLIAEENHGSRGGLSRTSSAKPRRAHMWQQWRAGYLVGAELLSMSGPDRDPGLLEKVRSLFERTRESAVIPDDATVHFEGSLAEGFGNDGSDIDLLLLVPGAGTVKSTKYWMTMLSTQEFPSNATVCCVPSNVSSAPCSWSARLTPA